MINKTNFLTARRFVPRAVATPQTYAGQSISRVVAGVLVCCVSLALTGCTITTGASTSASAAAVSITKAEMGTGETDKYEVVNPTTTFAPDTAKIFCVWKAVGIKAATALRGVWIAEDVGKAAPPNYKIDEATLHLPFANEGSFTLSKPNSGFPVGKYRLEIYVGTDLLKTVPFTIEAE